LAKSSSEQKLDWLSDLDLDLPEDEGAPGQEVSEPQVQLHELPAEAAAELRQMAPPQPSPAYEYGYALTRKLRDNSSVVDVYGVALGKPSKEVETAILQAVLKAGFNQCDKSQQSLSEKDVFVYVWCMKAEVLDKFFESSVKNLLDNFFQNIPVEEEKGNEFILTIRRRISWELQIGISLLSKPGDAVIIPIRLTEQWSVWDALAFLQDALTQEGGSPNYDANSPRDPLDFARDLLDFLLTQWHLRNTFYLPSFVCFSFALRGTPGEPAEVRRQGIRQACREILKALIDAPLDVGAIRTEGLSGIKAINAFLIFEMELCHNDGVSELEKSKKIPPLSKAKLPKMPPGRPPQPRNLRMDLVRQMGKDMIADLEQHQRAILTKFQEYLDGLVGKACPTFAENQELVEEVKMKAQEAGVTILARDNRKEGDGKYYPATINCTEPDSKSGIFVASSTQGNRLDTGAQFPQFYAQLGRPTSVPEK
jgi:hypothetical protein